MKKELTLIIEPILKYKKALLTVGFSEGAMGLIYNGDLGTILTDELIEHIKQNLRFNELPNQEGKFVYKFKKDGECKELTLHTNMFDYVDQFGYGRICGKYDNSILLRDGMDLLIVDAVNPNLNSKYCLFGHTDRHGQVRAYSDSIYAIDTLDGSISYNRISGIDGNNVNVPHLYDLIYNTNVVGVELYKRPKGETGYKRK